MLHFGTGVADEPTIALDSAARGGMDGNSDSGRSPQMGPQGGIVADGSAWCGATSEVEDGVHRPLYFEAPATSYSPTLTGTAIVTEPVQPPDATRPDSGASGRMPSEWMELGPAPLGTMQRVLPPAWAQATEAGEAHTAMSAALAVAPAAALAVAPAAALAVAPAPSLAVAPAPSLAVAPAQSAGGSGQGAHASESSAEVMRELSTYLSLKYPEREEMLELLVGNVKLYGSAYRGLLHFKLINGTLRALGLGTGGGERRERTLPLESGEVPIKAYDVVHALRSTRYSFDAWRNSLRWANSVAKWMMQNRGTWDVPDKQETQRYAELFQVLQVFFATETLPPMARWEERNTAVSVLPEPQSDVSAAVQRARGGSMNALDADVKDIVRAFKLKRLALPPPTELLD